MEQTRKTCIDNSLAKGGEAIGNAHGDTCIQQTRTRNREIPDECSSTTIDHERTNSDEGCQYQYVILHKVGQPDMLNLEHCQGLTICICPTYSAAEQCLDGLTKLVCRRPNAWTEYYYDSHRVSESHGSCVLKLRRWLDEEGLVYDYWIEKTVVMGAVSDG